MEDSIECVVVTRGDWIKFMIMTPRAAERQSQKRPAEVVERVFNGQMLRIIVNAGTKTASVRNIPCGNDSLLTLLLSFAASPC